MSTGENQNRNNAHRGPEESRGEERGEVLVAEEADGEDKGDDHGCNDVGNGVEGLVHFVRMRCEGGDPIVQVVDFEATVGVSAVVIPRQVETHFLPKSYAICACRCRILCGPTVGLWNCKFGAVCRPSYGWQH